MLTFRSVVRLGRSDVHSMIRRTMACHLERFYFDLSLGGLTFLGTESYSYVKSGL